MSGGRGGRPRGRQRPGGPALLLPAPTGDRPPAAAPGSQASFPPLATAARPPPLTRSAWPAARCLLRAPPAPPSARRLAGAAAAEPAPGGDGPARGGAGTGNPARFRGSAAAAARACGGRAAGPRRRLPPPEVATPGATRAPASRSRRPRPPAAPRLAIFRPGPGTPGFFARGSLLTARSMPDNPPAWDTRGLTFRGKGNSGLGEHRGGAPHSRWGGRGDFTKTRGLAAALSNLQEPRAACGC